MARSDDDRDRRDAGRDDDTIGRGLYNLGGFLSGLAGGKEGREAWEEGIEQLAPGATPSEIGAALETGILAGQNLTERRRALRAYHDQLAREEHAPPLVDTTLIESEMGEMTGLRVLVSDPDADVYAGDDHVLILCATGDGGRHERRVDVPFGSFEIEHHDAEGVTDFVARRATPPADTSEPAEEVEPETNQKAESSADVDADAGGGGEEETDEASELADVDEPEPYECVYCEAPVTDPAEHHLEEHPGKRFDPVWYLDGGDEAPTADDELGEGEGAPDDRGNNPWAETFDDEDEEGE